MKVLIVEDQKPVAEMLARYLAPISCEIVVAETMQKAMRHISTEPPFDLVTLDLGLPDSSVDQSIEKIRDIRAMNPAGLVVVITGMVGREYEKRVLELGADGFLTKMDSIEKQGTFIQNLWDTVKSAFRNPTRYQENLELAEKLTNKLGTIMPALSESTVTRE